MLHKKKLYGSSYANMMMTRTAGKIKNILQCKSWELQSAKENPGSCWIHNQRFSPTHQLLLALRAPPNGDVRKPGRTLEAGVLVSPIYHHPAVRINHLCNQNPSSQWGSLGCNFEKDMSMGTNTGTKPWQGSFRILITWDLSMRSRTLVKVTDQAVLLTRPITPPPLAQTLFANSHSSRSTRSFLSSSRLVSSS